MRQKRYGLTREEVDRVDRQIAARERTGNPVIERVTATPREERDMTKNPHFHLLQGWVSSFSPDPPH